MSIFERWCARFIRKVVPAKTFKRLQKPSKTPAKTIKCQSQKVGHIVSNFIFLHFLATCPKKWKKMVRSAFFCWHSSQRIMSLEDPKHGNGSKFEHCVYAHASPCFVGDNSKLPGFFHDPLLYSMQRVGEWHKIGGSSTGHEVHDRFLEISTKTSTFWIIVQKKKNIHRGGPETIDLLNTYIYIYIYMYRPYYIWLGLSLVCFNCVLGYAGTPR